MASLPLKARFAVYKVHSLGLRRPKWRNVSGSLQMFLDPSDPTDTSFNTGNFAHELRRYIKSFVRPGESAIDAGAHKGFISLHLARAVGPTGMVLSFEPDDAPRKLLVENLRKNRMQNVTVKDCALNDRDGTAIFLSSNRPGVSGLYRYPYMAKTTVSELSVTTRTLDSLHAAGDLPLQRLDFMKIDCQGAEQRVLTGARGLIERYRPAIWFEVDRDCLAAAGSTAANLDRLLRELDYELYLPEIGRIFEVPFRFTLRCTDCLPNQRGDYDVLAIHPQSSHRQRLQSAIGVPSIT